MDGSIDSESEATEVKRDSLAYVHTEVSRKEDIDHDLKVLLTPFPYLTHFSLSEGVVTIHSVTFFFNNHGTFGHNYLSESATRNAGSVSCLQHVKHEPRISLSALRQPLQFEFL